MSMQVKKTVTFTADQIRGLRDLMQGVHWATDDNGKRNFYVSKNEAKVAQELSSFLQGCDSLYMSIRATESD